MRVVDFCCDCVRMVLRMKNNNREANKNFSIPFFLRKHYSPFRPASSRLTNAGIAFTGCAAIIYLFSTRLECLQEKFQAQAKPLSIVCLHSTHRQALGSW